MGIYLDYRTLVYILALIVITMAQTNAIAEPSVETPKVTIKVVANGDSVTPPEECHTILVGSGVNEPDPFPGYRGFVGWESPIRLCNGTMLVGFNAGYWHFSPPTPFTDEVKAEADNYGKSGMPLDVDAPTGGRAMIIRSVDSGKTWSKPQTLVDTPWDDRHPAFVATRKGTIICTFFAGCLGDYKTRKGVGFRTMVTRSKDNGLTWEKPKQIPTPFLADETDGPLVLAKDGSIYMAIDGWPKEGGNWQAAVLRSTNDGKDWKVLSILKADHELSETNITELPDGTMVLIARPEGDLAWSYDHGKTWTPFASLGMQLFAPSLQVLQDGTLLCIHGSNAVGGLRCTFSRDGGKTWIAPAPNYGFLIDRTYGYGKGVQLPDGSIFLAYIKSGGHAPGDALSNAVMNIRMRIRSDYSGIDLLPAPNR